MYLVVTQYGFFKQRRSAEYIYISPGMTEKKLNKYQIFSTYPFFQNYSPNCNRKDPLRPSMRVPADIRPNYFEVISFQPVLCNKGFVDL